MSSLESSEQYYNSKKFVLQTSVLQAAFGVTEEEMMEIMQGENAKDPRLAGMLLWIDKFSVPLSAALLETPESERAELFGLLEKNQLHEAAERFLSAHPEFQVPKESLARSSEYTLH